MSETLKNQQESYEQLSLDSLQSQQNELNIALRMEGDRGAINTEVFVRGAEAIRDGVTSARIAYHGLAERVRELRGGWADNRVEKMNRKNRLYSHLGNVATQREGAGRSDPKTFIERIVDTRLENRAFEKGVKSAQRRMLKGGNSDVGYKTRFKSHEQKRAIDKRYRNGEILAGERRTLRSEVDMNPEKFATSQEGWNRRRDKLSNLSMELAAKQPISSKWRNRRRKEAIKDAEHHRAKAQKHRDKADELRSRT